MLRTATTLFQQTVFFALFFQWSRAQDSGCDSNPCQHGGLCKDATSKIDSYSYSCNCTKEWSGQNCEQDVDECTSRPCKNMGSCSNTEGSFLCNCLTQWVGLTCERPSQCGSPLYYGWPSIELHTLSGPLFTNTKFSEKMLLYICRYTITNLKVTGRVQLIFDDFMLYGSKTSVPCHNEVKIYDGSSSNPIVEQCFASYSRPPAIVSSDNSLRVEFEHWGSMTYQYPAFKAQYRFLSSDEQAFRPIVDTLVYFQDHISQFSTVLWQYQPYDMLWLFVAPKKKHVYLSLHPIYISKEIEITLDIHDGLSSYAPKVSSLQYRYHFPALVITSSSNGLYMRCCTNQPSMQNVTIAGVFVFFFEVETSVMCPDYWCANQRCISSAFECDGVNHCGDNSDEKPCLGLCPENWCTNGGTCHDVTSGYPRCTCQPNYSGERCQEEEVCPIDYCENGGTCRGSSVTTRYCICKKPYSGGRCEQDNSGCPPYYCHNGGTCDGTHDRYHCKCPSEFTGIYCELKYLEVYEEDTVHASLTYTLITVIPAALLLMAIWVCCRMRHCDIYPLNSRRRDPVEFQPSSRDRFSVSTDNPSTVSRSLSRMSAGSSGYSDEPPAYNAVVRHQRRKLRRHHSHPGPTTTTSSEEPPPPSYESVVVAALNGRGQQSEPPPYIRCLQRSQARGRRRSLELLSQVVILEMETRSPLLPGSAEVEGSTGAQEELRDQCV